MAVRYEADRLEIHRQTDHYLVTIHKDGRTRNRRAGTLNVGGRTFAVRGSAEFGAGDSTLIVEHLEDSRAPYGLMAIRYGAEIGLTGEPVGVES